MLQVAEVYDYLVASRVTFVAFQDVDGEYKTFRGGRPGSVWTFSYHIPIGRTFQLWMPFWRKYRKGELVDEKPYLVERLPLDRKMLSYWSPTMR